MAKTIEFDKNGGKLHAKMEMTGAVIISYTLQYWSADVQDEKIVQTESGNNKQSHDDQFWLRNTANESEPVSANDDRFLESICTVHTGQDNVDYEIDLIILQEDSNGNPKELDRETKSGTIEVDENGHRPLLGIILKGI